MFLFPVITKNTIILFTNAGPSNGIQRCCTLYMKDEKAKNKHGQSNLNKSSNNIIIAHTCSVI